MLKQVTPLILIAAVTACSSPVDRRQANGGDEYVNALIEPALVIPDGLNTPTYSKEYEIPKFGAKSDVTLVGKMLDIRPPLQVLPMAEGTRVEEGSDNIKIVVESIDNDIDLKKELFDVLKSYLSSKSIAILNEDYEKGIIETDWLESEEIIDSNLWGSDEIYLLRQRYQFHVDVRPHGRSGNISIDLIEHAESFNGEQQDIVLSGEDKRRYTIDMLNNAVAYMSIKRAQSIKAKRIKESLGIDVAVIKGSGPDVEGEDVVQSYWLADAPFKRTWERLRIVLPELGFEIIDMDVGKGLYYVNVNDDSGFWSSLWNEKDLPINEGSYRLQLKEDATKDKTEIYLHDVENQPLDNAAIEAIYEGLAELMKEERKVR
ncbi:outer membrane protein assembly factor BamC [Shewanella sp. D64]|uniref:outer membrane protein assembly factor BamC n=1 Tax=unclassified Shewanella TaxID=196818 RepID=UPI0022BA4905|nr:MULTISPECIES: outer membrane protein assembly factor BamC [unclassified Shewanella]MEC4724224.1 outer membrane protein assembly factor BamC [Shewanella sp. D64]MEC4736244.1 outer membrane protein assembly factor BamC [Shewanella sp. E94]WBJ97824.1 outer membrane protein assembly factor BamC [Shewanella sp. MTB7]